MANEIANEIAKRAINIQTKVSAGKPLAVNEFKSVVAGFKSQIESALPLHLKKNAEKYARQALTLFSENPKLQQATPVSILSALMKASALGLDLNPQLGQAYIIPYDNRKKDGKDWHTVTEAQFQLGYRGAIALAMRSNRVMRITADCVYSNDKFEYSKGLFPKLEHIPADADRGEIVYVYALANFTNGGYAFDVWTADMVKNHAMKFSKSYFVTDYQTRKQVINSKSPWHTDFESMAKKTLILSIWKYMPIETELMIAGMQDETTVSRQQDISSLMDEKKIIDIMPDMPDASEYEEPDVPRQEQTAAESPRIEEGKKDPSEQLRILTDNMGEFGLGLNAKEIAVRIKTRFDKKPEELTAQEALIMNNEIIEEIKNRG